MIRYDIQGLRAIAVMSIVIFHAFPTVLPGGFVGVDIFFVISGYLITGIITKELSEERFSIGDFYRRRVRRIIPALVVVILFCATVGALCLSPKEYAELGSTVVSTICFVSNFHFWRLSGYFDSAADLKPLLHTWSLAVEEQFYILYPPLLSVVWRYRRAYIAPVLICLFVASLLISEAMVRYAPLAGYFFSPARGFELLTGAIVAMRPIAPFATQWGRAALSLTGLFSVVASLVFYSPETPFPGIAALVPCLGTAMVIHAGMDGPSLAGRLISHAVFRFFGALSYSIYLWHWPLLAFARNIFGLDLNLPQAGGAVVLTVALATLSYRLVERPFIDGRRKDLPYLLVGAVSIAVLTVVGASIGVLQGLPRRYSPSVAKIYETSFEFNPQRAACHNEHAPVRAYAANCVFGASGGVAPDVAVWGDSHGAELAVALGRRAAEVGRSVMEITSSACPPSVGYALRERGWCTRQNRVTLDGLTQDSHVKTVVLTTNAPRYSNQLALEEGYEAGVRALLAAGKHVFVLQQIPTMRNDPPARVGMAVRLGQSPDTIGRPRVEYDHAVHDWNLFLDRIATMPGVEVLSPAAILCDDNVCHEFKQGVGVLYFDADHLSVSGAGFMASGLIEKLYGSRAAALHSAHAA